MTVEAETEPFEARRASNKKSGWGMKCLIHFFYPTSTRGRGRPVDDPAEPERRPSRQARPNHSKPDGLRKKKRMELYAPSTFLSSNVHERIRTSDLPLRSSPEFCISRYHKLSNIACFQAFWMVQIACSYHCFHLIPVRRMPSLLQPCCKARKFSRTSSVSISTI